MSKKNKSAPKNENIKRDMIVKMYDDIFSLVHDMKVEKKELSGEHEIKTVDVDLNSDGLFSIYKKIYKFMNKSNIDLVDKLFKILDSVGELDSASSVTTTHEISVYKTVLKDEGVKESSFAKLSKITLLEHVEDIVDCLVSDYEKNIPGCDDYKEWFSIAELRHLLLLAIAHDLGKIVELMKMFEISLGDKKHEERSMIFMEMVFEGGKYDEVATKTIQRLNADLLRIVVGKNDTNSIIRFHGYDKQARIIELNRLAKTEHGK